MMWYSNRDNSLYLGLMDGTDVPFASEDPLRNHAIHMLIFIDFDSSKAKGMEPLETMKVLMKQIVVQKDSKYWKLACLKKYSTLGYYYWERQRSFNIDEHVKWMPIEAEDMTEEALRDLVNSVSSLHLPKGNRATWELLVGRGPVLGSSWGTPLLFRILHCVGDGSAFISFVEESLAVDPLSRHPSPIDHSLLSIPGHKKSELRFKNQLVMMTRQVVDKAITYLLSFEYTIRQTLMILDHKLHVPQFSAVTNVSFLVEDPQKPGEASLMEKVKRIRESFGCRFNDVLLAAVAVVLRAHLKDRPSLRPPQELAVFLPTILPDQGQHGMRMDSKSGPWAGLDWMAGMMRKLPEGRLNNNSTFGFVRVPLLAEGNLLDRLEKVRRGTARLRASRDFKQNAFFTEYLPTIVPAPILELVPFYIALSVSNLPGPKKCGTLAGHPIKNLVFSTTSSQQCGFAIVCHSYGEMLNFSLMVDSAIIPDKDEVDAILGEIVASIQEVYELWS